MWFKNAVSQVCGFKSFVTGLIVAAVVSVTTLAQAQSVPVTIDIPNIDYVGVVTNFMTAITPALACAIGLGLSIWAIAFIYRKFRSFAR